MGWSYSPSLLTATSTVYSFGIGADIAFESDLIARHGLTVHAFDPTPYSTQWIETRAVPERFHFHAYAAAGNDGTLRLYPRKRRSGRGSEVNWTADPAQADSQRWIDAPARSIPSLMAMLGSEKLDLVKLDVEGAEYEVIAGMLGAGVRPTQLLVEFHHRFPGFGKRRTLDCVRELRAAGYRVFYISSTGAEVGFVLLY